MKEALEVEFAEKAEHPALDQPLRGPIEWRSRERAEEKRRREVGEQFGCVFQDCM